MIQASAQEIEYPETKKEKVVEKYHGKKIIDPYRWLEDEDDIEVHQWIEKQNALTFSYLEKIPYRDKLKKRLKFLWNYEKQSVPFKGGDKYFYFRNDGVQNQSVLWVKEGDAGEIRELLNPNELSPDGTIAISDVSVSKDGLHAAVSITEAGSDWNEIWILDVNRGVFLDEKLKWIKFSNSAWAGKGFYYSRYDAPKEGEELTAKVENHKVYYHALGTNQEEDLLIFSNDSDPQRNYYAQTTFDERYLIIYESESTSGNALFVKDLSNSDNDFVQLVQGFKNDYTLIGNLENSLLIHTNAGAPNYQLMMVNMMEPQQERWRELIPQMDDQVMESVSIAENKIVCVYMKDAVNRLEIYEYTGDYVGEIELPGLGTISSFQGEPGEPLAYYGFTSFTHPEAVFTINFEDMLPSLYWEPQVEFEKDKYETKQVFYQSKDGTKVPMFIVHNKELELNGSNPTILYGYGGFNISLTPGFRVSRLMWLEAGGVYAIANIRGGGEYGKKWHQAGTKENKQNVFDDFIAAAEYLITEKYTSSEKLAISGGSNGGLLVGACMTQRPDLFKVALPAVGVLDMLRYHKFTIGWAWASDYGTSDKKDEFKYLIKYSPLHTIEKGVNYPATLVTTADHDDRVVPAHSFKFIATLQENHKGENPVMIRVETKAGHGAGKPVSKMIDEIADVYAFTLYNMGIKGNKNETEEDMDSDSNSKQGNDQLDIPDNPEKKVKPGVKKDN